MKICYDQGCNHRSGHRNKMTALPILFAKGLTKIVPLVAASMFVKFKRNLLIRRRYRDILGGSFYGRNTVKNGQS